MYRSPIEIIYGQMEKQMEGDILRAVQKYDINVDKEELTRALQYDRNQYEKGYADGKADALKWISVKDRLPEYGQPVLVCDVREDYVGMAVLQPAKHFVFSKSEDYWDWDRMECNLDEFTHWQYLPEPPKGE